MSEHTDLPSASQVTAAIYILACRIIIQAVEDIEWQNYPDIGENDWQRIVARIDEIVGPFEQDPAHVAAAYTLLENRVER